MAVPTGGEDVKLIDPIAVLVERRRAEHGAEPAPLVAVEIEVTIRGGLALVETTRTYVNGEKQPIEALLSIPVPVHAAFFGLSARIGERLYLATAMPRDAAREQYEDAVEEGKAAVLHEELLRGVHALSVANLAAGEKARVTTRWAEPLRFQNASGHLRIPLTVGDVYGVSGLPDSDEMIHGGPEPRTRFRVRHDALQVQLAGGTLVPLEDGGLFAEVPGNAPIDLQVNGWTHEALIGRSANGREVALTLEPDLEGDENLDVAVLVDHSGSMASPCEGSSRTSMSKHQAVTSALRNLGGLLRDSDRIALWEFDHSCSSVGSGRPVGPTGFKRLVPKLSEPSGGTEIGGALDAVASVEARDVLLITDGMSYALDVQRHALAGRRVFVILVGEDSLEAKVGHLAALTGGDLQFSFGADAGRALGACLRGMRSHRVRHAVCEVDARGSPQRVRAARGNASIEARWTGEKGDCERDSFSAAVAAYAASLAVAASSEELATGIAVEEGLVTHLTSLFLEVEDRPTQTDLPVTRKVRLPTPRSSQLTVYSALPPAGDVFAFRPMQLGDPAEPKSRQKRLARLRLLMGSQSDEADLASVPVSASFHQLAVMIDWDTMGPALARGNLCGVPPPAAEAIRDLSEQQELEAAALSLGIDSLRLAIALVAHSAATGSRAAARVCRRLLRKVDSARFERLAQDFDADRTSGP